jgi:hypothetical protein
MPMADFSHLFATLVPLKKTCTSGLFWGLASHNID